MTTNEHPDNSASQSASAVQQFVETFDSLDELFDLFDGVLGRVVWAYTGRTQATHDLVGDYDFINQLKQALKADHKA